MKYSLRSRDNTIQDTQSECSEEEIIHFQKLNDVLIAENEHLKKEINKKDIEIFKINQERNNLRNENIQLSQQILDFKIQIINLQKDINFVKKVNICLLGFFMICMGYYLYRRIPFRKF